MYWQVRNTHWTWLRTGQIKKILIKKVVDINKNDYGYEIGFGFDFYLDYIKFSPEMKMFNGVHNLSVHNGSEYGDSIEKMYSKVLMFSITFE